MWSDGRGLSASGVQIFCSRSKAHRAPSMERAGSTELDGTGSRWRPRIWLNRFSAVFICIWVVWPQVNYHVPAFWGVLAAIVWLLSTGRFLLPRSWTADLGWFVWFLACLVPYLVLGRFHYGNYSPGPMFGAVALFIVGAFMASYYMHFNGDPWLREKLFWIVVVSYVVGSVQSLVGLASAWNAARLLAVGGPESEGFREQGVGGFGFVYGAVIIAVPLVFIAVSLRTKLALRVTALLATVLVLGLIWNASYTMALIAVSLSLLCLLVARRTIWVWIFSGLFLVFLFGLGGLAGRLVQSVAVQLPQSSLFGSRLAEVSVALRVGALTGDVGQRSELFGSSLAAFKEFPLFGVNGPWSQVDSAVVGGHSGWLDLLAYFGVLGAVPLFVGVVLHFRWVASVFSGSGFEAVVAVTQVMFLFLGFFNPMVPIYTLGFTMFVAVPLAGCAWVNGRALPYRRRGRMEPARP